MPVLFIVVPIAVVFVTTMVVAFIWAAHRGQFDDLKTPAIRILADENGVSRRRAPPHRGADPDLKP